MTAMRFVDTNVLLYRISFDPAEAVKREVAEQILESSDLQLSVQVLQEFYVQATRPSKKDAILHEEALALVNSWKRFPVQEISVPLLDAALIAKSRWQLSYWDAAIIEAARITKCEVVLSEDLSHGQNYDGVTIINPFSEQSQRSRQGSPDHGT